MIRWRTLNKGDNIEEEANAEIQVEHLLELFQTALKIHQRGERVDAKAKYELILENDVMTEEDTEEQTKGDALHSSSLVLLRFLVFKNYAAIIEDESKLPSCTKDERDTLLSKAMDYYIKALMIDPSERSLWHRIGLIADSLGNLRLARSSFEKGLFADPTDQQPKPSSITRQNEDKLIQLMLNNSSISPTQWRCLEGLCDVLYKIGDYNLCNLYVKSGLQRFPSWSFGKCLNTKLSTTTTTNNLNNHQPSPHDDIDMADAQHDQPIIMHIDTPSWAGLISVLLENYKQIFTKKKDKSEYHQKQNSDADDGYLLMNRAVRIHIDSVDDPTTCRVQDAEMEDMNNSANKTAEDTTSTQNQQQQQPQVNNLETHNDTNTTTDTVDDMQIDSLPTTTDTTVTTKIKKEDHSIDISATILQQNDQQATDDPSTLTSSMTNQQNDQQPTNEPSASNPPIATSQQNDKSASIKKPEIVDLTLDDDDDDDADNVHGPLKRKSYDQNDNDDSNSTFKRPRNDEFDKVDDGSGDDEGDDDEHEQEDKRTSLRASKRQKEKVESEGIFKKRMMTEERSLSNKAQELFDSFENMDGLRRDSPWFKPMVLDMDASVLESFWEFFDVKVSELGANFTWNFDNMKARDDLISPSYSKKHQFAKFEITNSPSALPSTNHESATIRQFINSLNKTNSGTADSLCQTIIAILRRDLDQFGDIDDDTTSLTIDAVEALGQEILSTMLFNGNQDLWVETNDYVEQIQLLTSLSEKLVDRLINAIRTEQSSSIGPTLSSKQRSLADRQNKFIKQNQERCNFWVSLIGNSFIHDTMNSFGPCSLVDNENTNELDGWIKKKKLLLRYWLLKGKLALCENDVDKAMDWYKKCERLFENTNEGDLDMSLGCIYDAAVNLSTIKRKMQLMEWDKHFDSSKSKLDSDDYVGALSQLETLMSIHPQSDQATNMHDISPMTTMLAKCYMKTERYLDAWECYAGVLVSLIQELVLYGGDRMANNSILPKGDDLEFFRILCSIDTVVDSMVHLLEINCQDWLPQSLNSKFIDTVMILLRTTTIYTFRHPDFIPLVNNFSNPDVTPHAPSKKTKINSFNGVTAKSWVMISTLAQHKMRQENSGGSLALLTNLLQSVHDELGEREVCCASKGIFIQHLVKLLSSVAPNEHRRGIYQCYHCLYGVHLVAESELIEEHHAVHGTIDEKAAENLYSLVVDEVLTRIDQNASLKIDLKDAIETVSALFEELPVGNPYIQQNRGIIKNYLDKPVNIDQPINAMLQQCDLPIDILHTNLSSLSVVYGHIFFIRGKILRQHIKNRPKGSSDKTMIDLEEALEQFQYHVIIHPVDHQGWYELGSTFLQLAEEELTWSAVNVITHHDLIVEYQRHAFHCFMKAWQLSSYGYRLKKKQLAGFFTGFGSLVYGMACAPMKMASFGRSQSSKVIDESGGLHDVQPRNPDPASAYRLSLEFYSRALNYKSPDHSEWKALLGIGRCFKNLRRPPKEVLGWYLKSIRQCQDLGGTGNLPLDPTYKLYAALLKYLYQQLIEPADVIFYLKQASAMSNTNQDPPTTTSSASMTLCQAAEDSNSMTGIVDLTDSADECSLQREPGSIGKMEAFDMIFDKLVELRKWDKKHVHHRPLYKVAWMYYKIYNDPQQAKTEILQLFTLKQTNKGLFSIWRSEHERPGKQFVFIKQYVYFLIDLAKETNDLETLRNMCRKLKKAGTMLFNEEEAFKRALAVYIEVLQKEKLVPQQGSAKRQQIIMGLVEWGEFDKACKSLTNELAPSIDANRNMVTILHDLVDIRRHAFGYVSTGNLDIMIQECFAVLLFERTQMQSPLSQGSLDTSITTTPSSAPAIQTTDNDINSNSHGTETSGTIATTTSMDTTGDIGHTATLTTGNESKDQDDGNEKCVDESVLLLRARAFISALYPTSGRSL